MTMKEENLHNEVNNSYLKSFPTLTYMYIYNVKDVLQAFRFSEKSLRH